jgi:hypothetical protein
VQNIPSRVTVTFAEGPISGFYIKYARKDKYTNAQAKTSKALLETTASWPPFSLSIIHLE